LLVGFQGFILLLGALFTQPSQNLLKDEEAVTQVRFSRACCPPITSSG